MQSDPFAAIRKSDTGFSASFPAVALHALHADSEHVLRGNPQKTAAVHVLHSLHAENTKPEDGTDNAPMRPFTVPTIRDRDYAALPGPWCEGLKLLNRMAKPKGADAERWAQIVLDAHVFAWGWADDPAIEAWSIGSLMGFDPSDPVKHCLIRDIRGGCVISLFKDDRGRDVAGITGPNRPRQHYRRMPDDAVPLWALGAREMQS